MARDITLRDPYGFLRCCFPLYMLLPTSLHLTETQPVKKALFCIYQHINFQLCDMGGSSVPIQEKKEPFFSLEEMKICSGN